MRGRGGRGGAGRKNGRLGSFWLEGREMPGLGRGSLPPEIGTGGREGSREREPGLVLSKGVGQSGATRIGEGMHVLKSPTRRLHDASPQPRALNPALAVTL